MPFNYGYKASFLLRRIYKFLGGLQDIVESVTCDSVKFGRATLLESGGATQECWVRWWAPATWLAWIRTVVFRDDFGCFYYRRRNQNASQPHTAPGADKPP